MLTCAVYLSGDERSEKKRPVIIHRAILGSVERMMAILCESYGGKWYALLYRILFILSAIIYSYNHTISAVWIWH